ncbi:hypothetical protein PAT3040_05483, partial [Paenibacillus agaridevorans]
VSKLKIQHTFVSSFQCANIEAAIVS